MCILVIQQDLQLLDLYVCRIAYVAIYYIRTYMCLYCVYICRRTFANHTDPIMIFAAVRKLVTCNSHKKRLQSLGIPRGTRQSLLVLYYLICLVSDHLTKHSHTVPFTKRLNLFIPTSCNRRDVFYTLIK